MPQPDQFTWNDFSGGWQPSSDDVNGPKNALLQMDNVELDKNGALTLAGATSVIRTYSHNATDLYSNMVGGTRHDYVADDSGVVSRDASGIISGGDTTVTAFGQAFDFTLIASGTQRKKDSGSAIVNLGIGTPASAPVAFFSSLGPFIVLKQSYTAAATSVKLAQQLAAGGTMAFVDNADITFELFGAGAILVTLTPTSVPVDMTALSNTASQGTDSTDNDILYVPLFYAATNTVPLTNLTSITFAFWLDAATDNPSDYFEWTWKNDGTMGNIPTPRRSDFTRYGSGSMGWEAVQVYAFLFTASDVTAPFKFLTEPRFYGGLKGSLDGTYQWMQVNVSTNSGQFISKSGASALSTPLTVQMGSVQITATTPTDSQIDQAWIYRRGGNLGQWYRTLVVTSPWSGVGFIDTLSDEDALTLGITFDPTLLPVDSAHLTDQILDIVGPVEGRWFYFTTNFMYPSDINDPDLVAPTLGIRTTGSNSEIFLRAKLIAANAIIVLTSKDAYLLTGTFVTLPDGTVDIYYQSLGCKYPAISRDATSKEGIIFYLAADGWRSLDSNGTSQFLVNTQTDRLYRGITAYGYSVNTKIAPGTQRFPITLALNKLWCGIHGQARIEVLDTIRGYWRPVSIGEGDCTALCSTQDGQVLGFFASDKSLRLLDYQAGTSSQVVNILSPVFDNGTPRQRKDQYTLKIRANTGEVALTIKIIDETQTTHTIGTVTTSSLLETDLDVSQIVAIITTFQFVLTGTFTALQIDDISLYFDTRPIPLTFIRIYNQNFGNASKKRLRVWPLMIDSQGKNVTFQAINDNSNGAVSTLNTPDKTTELVYYKTDIFAKDYGATLYCPSGTFEFWGMMSPDIVQVLPIARQFDQLGPEELFRYGRIKQMEIRVLTFGTQLSYTIYFNDNSVISNIIPTLNGQEASYFVIIPQGVSGSIVRIELGPTGYDFHRFYIRLQVYKTGRDTELEWVTIPDPTEGQ